MNELGIIVDQNGTAMSFGKWKIRDYREFENSDDWHSDSFIKDIYNTTWFQNLAIPYNPDKEFQTQLDLFARCGVVVIVNGKENSIKPGEIRIVAAIPNTITNSQIEYFNENKDRFINYEKNHFSYIDVFDVDSEYNILEKFFHIEDFYKYLDKLNKSKIKIK